MEFILNLSNAYQFSQVTKLILLHAAGRVVPPARCAGRAVPLTAQVQNSLLCTIFIIRYHEKCYYAAFAVSFSVFSLLRLRMYFVHIM